MFGIGAWVRDDRTARMTGSIVKGRFYPCRGEIVSIGTLCKLPAYEIRFAESRSLVLASDVVCDGCGAPDDNSHAEPCIAQWLRSQPHEPGYAPA